MTLQSKSLIRHCPSCRSDRPVTEMFCENCSWPLADEPIREEGVAPEEPVETQPVASGQRRCVNGHDMEDQDEICMICGTDAQPVPTILPEPSETREASKNHPNEIGQWHVIRPRGAPVEDGPFFQFEGRGPDGRDVIITLYKGGVEPDPAVHDVLRRMSIDYIPELIETGRHEGRSYEVIEHIPGGSLADAGFQVVSSPQQLRHMVEELSRALAAFAELGLRHRDLNPKTILVRSAEPLDLVVTGFGSARLSDFDLEAVATLELTRYSAPEAIVGAVSAASDWWSLGMILLEQATAGRAFEGVDDQAFRLHVVTRGVPLPHDLDPALRLLLRGLLARDPLKRWSAPQVRAWLAGDDVDAPEVAEIGGEPQGPAITLAGQTFARPDAFALAAAEAASWDAARDLVMRGAVATWLEERSTDRKVIANVRRLAADATLNEDLRHALVLMALNPTLPLTQKGEIVTPAWLLAHPDLGYAIVTGDVTRHLERMDRESWLVRLRTRAEAVRERAKVLEIELDEERVKVSLLASSRVNLEAERDAIRQVYPDTDHAGLASIVERPRLSDEDLIILVAAASHQFIPLANLCSSALELAREAEVALDLSGAEQALVRSRRELFAQVDERIANFARCGVRRIDEWADAFRVERRMSLPRAVVLLAVPQGAWVEPPKQQYVATLLTHFEKRVAGAVSRGPLARFAIGKTTPRLDLHELGTSLRPADAVLNHVLSRAEKPVQLDPTAYIADENRERRLRRLVSHAAVFRRDTGLDGRTLGFPFLLMREARSSSAELEARPRLAPILLWPVAFDMQPGAGAATIAFDREREEVRLNPALEGIIGAQAFAKWRAARDELLSRASIKLGDVIDIFGALATPRRRTLVRLPSKDMKVPLGTFELVPAAALFNAEFTGQSVAEDLRQMARMPPGGTGLDAALRIMAEPPASATMPPVSERDRFIIVESDPSQDAAVQRCAQAPGLLVEGPPGTGKSQTIVNVVADTIGRGETVLVVCQKQAALQVVKKRLDAEGLGERLFMVVDINRDREAILRDIRDQIAAVRAQPSGRLAAIRRQREETAARIEALEGDLDRHHKAVHGIDDVTGLSYRDMLSELVRIESAGPIVEAAALRATFATFPRTRILTIEEVCAPLARLWLDAKYEGNPLDALRPFQIDSSVSQTILDDLGRFTEAEGHRKSVLCDYSGAFDVDDPTPLKSWLQTHGLRLEDLREPIPQAVAAWLDLFRPSPGETEGAKAIRTLGEAQAELVVLDTAHAEGDLARVLTAQTAPALEGLHADAHQATAARSFLARLRPGWWAARRRARAFLEGHGVASDDLHIAALRDTASLEMRLRPLRERVALVRATLRLPSYDSAPMLRELIQDVGAILALLQPVAAACDSVFCCPRTNDAENAARQGAVIAFVALRESFYGAFARYDARARSQDALNALNAWFREEWIADLKGRIARNDDTEEPLSKIVAALDTLEPFQRFRARAAHLDADALQVFRVLRSRDAELRIVNRADLEELVRRTLQREALLAWKGRLEAATPELSYERDEVDRKIRTLTAADSNILELNRQFLCLDIDASKLGGTALWEDITRLRGPRARRLREIIDQGSDLGLMRLRPIWLMNPDVASRVLPLKAGLFDLVVYDEASQMPVEHAVPTLFRGKRILVAGDEKQMPPSSFFSGRIEDDEEDIGDDGFEDGVTDSERAAKEETWNRREVKDCPDLLQLGRGVLPSATLQIHYRSKYRELIGYSNAAFYKGELSVPARHPSTEVQRVRPIEVVRVNGVYERQTNPDEAARVVNWLAQVWAENSVPPSIGVVTFNRKQADLVEEAIEERAEADTRFLRAYRRERDRTQAGEDMGFFVKNVENVQGDERDVIVFSTTFGRDSHGAFRRNFGVLGQVGGERRLNVAVTRARQKVVLVTSIPVSDVSDWLASGRKADRPRDYLQAYLEYAERLSAGDLAGATSATERLTPRSVSRGRATMGSEDGFAAAVAGFVREQGFEPIPTSEGDAFGIDFAVEDARTGLFGIGIECDAPRHELLARARAREIWRPAVLRRAIPVVHRVSSHAWYHQPHEERARLNSALQAALA
jgi:primosomal replication protein N''